jgi:SAM-dependent methyltransferase
MAVPLATSAFDGVLCHLALMDIADLASCVAGIARILRPGGWFAFAITHPYFKAPATGEITDHVDGSVRRAACVASGAVPALCPVPTRRRRRLSACRSGAEPGSA